MQFDIIRSIQAFEALSDEWNQLLGSSASHVPFLRHEYLLAWWRTLGGGEWETGELCLVIARNSDGQLCAAAPMFYTQNREGEPALMLLGSIEISDYLDVLALPGQIEPFLEGLFAYLDLADLPPWRLLDWYNLLENSPTLAAMQSAAALRGWTYRHEQLQHCPYIPLPGDWETYLAGIDKKQRHEIRRKMRRAESAEVPVRWYITADESKLDGEIEDFLRLMGTDVEKQAFLTDVMRTQMHAAIWAAFRAGWLQLAFLEVDGNKAAGYLNFDFGNRIWVYNSGLDYEYGSFSPGWVLLGYLLQWANENQRESFDFMRGNEDYKYRFGAVDRFVMRATVRRQAG